MGKWGEEQVAIRSVIKKNTGPLQKWGAWGGKIWSVSTQEKSEDQKQFGKSEPSGVEREGRSRGWGAFGNWVKGLSPPPPRTPPPLLGSSSPPVLAEGAHSAISPPPPLTGRSGAARCSRQGAGGGSQRLALQGDDSTAPSFLARLQRPLSSWSSLPVIHA
uniref:Uncharacterized protein n=1 Tax=Pipistrellus kuhlii TaxID=59472 RepID=A0A7J8B2D1_PIPKU|nr:hypothetical protein mPipKuh1_007853 [Pipistrellus kuhlii]